MNEFLRSIAAKGYGWYLLLKVCKAVISVPMFAAYVVFWTLAAAVLAAWFAVKGVLWDFPKMMTATMAEYWERPWFRNFGRGWYRSQYESSVTPLPPIDATPEPRDGQ